MCQVEGSELFFFGPADFSSTAGARGQWEGPGVAESILQMKDTIRRAGKNCGVIAISHDNLLERRQQGFRMIGVGIDSGLLLRSLRRSMSSAETNRSRRHCHPIQPTSRHPRPDCAVSPEVGQAFQPDPNWQITSIVHRVSLERLTYGKQ
jgi:hypothetical protein